jgi:hypothetical protein
MFKCMDCHTHRKIVYSSNYVSSSLCLAEIDQQRKCSECFFLGVYRTAETQMSRVNARNTTY